MNDISQDDLYEISKPDIINTYIYIQVLEVYFSQFWSLDAHNQGASMVRF
jgi:hypothetical protein